MCVSIDPIPDYRKVHSDGKPLFILNLGLESEDLCLSSVYLTTDISRA